MSASRQAVIAVIAVRNYRKWGSYAACCFAMKEGALRHLDQALAFERRRAIRRAVAPLAGWLA